MPITKEETYYVKIFVTCENFERCKNFFEVESHTPVHDWEEAEKRGWEYEMGADSDRFFCPQCKEDRAWDYIE